MQAPKRAAPGARYAARAATVDLSDKHAPRLVAGMWPPSRRQSLRWNENLADMLLSPRVECRTSQDFIVAFSMQVRPATSGKTPGPIVARTHFVGPVDSVVPACNYVDTVDNIVQPSSQ